MQAYDCRLHGQCEASKARASKSKEGGGSTLYILGGNKNWIYEFIEPKFISEQGCRFVFQPRRLLGLRYKSSKRSQIV